MKLSCLFTDNMVLQANKHVKIFGCGKGYLTIDFIGKRYGFQIENYKWSVDLGTFGYGGPYVMELNLNGKKQTIRNVCIGEVLLCIGQSNMGFTVEEEKTVVDEKYGDNLRFFVVDSIEDKPLGYKDGWMNCKYEKSKYFSALAYHIAENLYKKKGIYIGCLCCYQGASNIQSWIKKDYLTKKVFVPLDKRDMGIVDEPYSKWTKDGIIYKKSFNKALSYVVSCAVWYQGESNTSIEEAKVYLELLSTFIKCVRKEGTDKDLKFIIVQICDYLYRNDDAWRSIQTAQSKAESYIDNVKVVESSDVCEHSSIHPANKIALGERISKYL